MLRDQGLSNLGNDKAVDRGFGLPRKAGRSREESDRVLFRLDLVEGLFPSSSGATPSLFYTNFRPEGAGTYQPRASVAAFKPHSAALG